MLFREQKLLPSHLSLDPRAPLYVTDRKPLDYGSGGGGERKHLSGSTMVDTWRGSLF